MHCGGGGEGYSDAEERGVVIMRGFRGFYRFLSKPSLVSIISDETFAGFSWQRIQHSKTGLESKLYMIHNVSYFKQNDPSSSGTYIAF